MNHVDDSYIYLEGGRGQGKTYRAYKMAQEALRNSETIDINHEVIEQKQIPMMTTFKSERPIEKKYFSIGKVAELFNVAPSLLRFWEGEFDILRPKKGSKGNRKFTAQDVDKVRMIYYLVKIRLFTIKGAILELGANGGRVEVPFYWHEKYHF